MIRPANRTPAITAMTVFLKSKSKMLAASDPVQAPVPGSGIYDRPFRLLVNTK